MYAALVEVIEHGNKVAQAAGQPVKFPDNETMSVSPSCNALRQRSRAGRLVVAPVRSTLKTFWHFARFKAASCKAGFCSSVETRA